MAGDLGPGVGDELLGAVDHPLAVLEPRPRAEVGGVRTGLGLGQPEGPELAAGAEVGKQALLLLVGAEQIDRLGAEGGVCAERDRDRRVDPGQLLDAEGVGERVATATAVAFRERDPHQPELAELGDDLVGEGLGPVELLGHRRDLAAGEVADRVANQALLVGGLEVQVPEAYAARSRARRTSSLVAKPLAPLPTYSRPVSQAVPAMSRWTQGTPSVNSSRKEPA